MRWHWQLKCQIDADSAEVWQNFSISNTKNSNIFKTWSHGIKNNTICWKRVARLFRCICVNCFNILRFFSSGQLKIEKMYFFDNLKTITQEGSMKTTQMTPFFSSTFSALPVYNIHFWIWKCLKFIFKFITLVHFGL